MPDFLDCMVVDSLLYALKVEREGEIRQCLWYKCRKDFVTHNVSQHCCSEKCAELLYNSED
jgi:hypothetical protein